ncbi:MAG: hypothetical protein WBO55_09875 [Rhizobiaceae bacterium]
MSFLSLHFDGLEVRAAGVWFANHHILVRTGYTITIFAERFARDSVAAWFAKQLPQLVNLL